MRADVVIIGGGIAGASVAYFLAPHASVVLLERESQPGYHTTGRSAAQWIATYGTAQARALTRASRAFFEAPPAGFATQPLWRRRAVMTIGLPGQEDLLDDAWQLLQASGGAGQRLSPQEALALVPVLRPERVLGAVLETDSFDMDVDALHQGFLRGARQAGARVVCDAEVTALHHDQGLWQVQAGGERWQAPVVVNAAGAWCDVIGQLAGLVPLGLVPKRRTAFMFQPPAGVKTDDWPLVAAADHCFYFKPDAGLLLGSPANEDPMPPQDVQPEELDIALGVHRIEENTTLQARPQRRWAGLRSFVPDGDLVGGFDATAPGFFWLAGQGGYGIQTAPAMGEACAALLRVASWPAHLSAQGLEPSMLSPARLRQGA